MKRVPADEFADHAAEYLAGSEEIAVVQDGEVIGRFVPSPNGPRSNGASSRTEPRRDPAEVKRAFDELRQVLQQIYAETGLTEDQFVDLFLMDPDDGPSSNDPKNGARSGS